MATDRRAVSSCRRMFGPELLEAFNEFKRIWDPTNRMNTGKVINLDGPAYGITDNLRIGPDYNPPQPKTYFAFTDDRHSFARAALRCVGVGACRREGGGTMCPSYMVTREEKDSTRGRARMLFEMMNGEVIEDGWKSEEVKDALDLCLSCKGCKGDCPVNVDMATYKAEFLSHYYEGRFRPRHAYAFGWIHIWSQLASFAPSLANLFTQTPGLELARQTSWRSTSQAKDSAIRAAVVQAVVSVASGAKSCGSAGRSLRRHVQQLFQPDVAIAATEVLEDAGFRVHVPTADVCCGRPLYDYGFLGMAKRWWIDLLGKLRPLLPGRHSDGRSGAELLGGVPGRIGQPAAQQRRCETAERTHLHAQRFPSLQGTWLLSSQAAAQGDRPRPLPSEGARYAERQGVRTSCSRKRKSSTRWASRTDIPKTDAAEWRGRSATKRKMIITRSGVAAGERVLLPEVRKADDDELIIADGFSCQEQIEQQTDRAALHTAQVLQIGAPRRRCIFRPTSETRIVAKRQRQQRLAMMRTAVVLAAGVLVTVLAVRETPATREQPEACRAIR